MNILGINTIGSASAALVVNGELIGCVEEHLFNGTDDFPVQAIRHLLHESDLSVGALDHVAIAMDGNTHKLRRFTQAFRKRPSLAVLRDTLRRNSQFESVQERLAIVGGCVERDIQATVTHVARHDAQIAYGYLLGPFESAAILSLDAPGDVVSTVLAGGNGEAVKRYRQVFHPHSIANLCHAVFGFLRCSSFAAFTALAQQGEPQFVQKLKSVVGPSGDTFKLNLRYFAQAGRETLRHGIDGAEVVASKEAFEELFGPARKNGELITNRHRDIAASLQNVVESLVVYMLNRLHVITAQSKLVMVGGLASNAIAKSDILDSTPFETVHFPAGTADHGAAVGAAYHVWTNTLGRRGTQPLTRDGFSKCHEAIGDSPDQTETRAELTTVLPPHFPPTTSNVPEVSQS